MLPGRECHQDALFLSKETHQQDKVSAADNNGESVSIREPGPAGDPPTLTIDDVFRFADGAILDADESWVEYDPKFGYPTGVGADWHQEEVDDETGVSIDDFEVLP